jgi:hypothetical protein
VAVRVTNPTGTIGTTGATTTMCPQQHRQPSAQQPSSESCDVCEENRQSGDAIVSQVRISVVARSSKKIVTTLRTIRHSTMIDSLIMPQKPLGYCLGVRSKCVSKLATWRFRCGPLRAEAGQGLPTHLDHPGSAFGLIPDSALGVAGVPTAVGSLDQQAALPHHRHNGGLMRIDDPFTSKIRLLH